MLLLVTTTGYAMENLPEYVVINDPNSIHQEVLRTKASPIAFPLSKEDKAMLQVLNAKFDAEENCAGLAAPQIGFSKRAIIFAVPEDPELKKWRSDLTQSMPKTLWINPSYAPLTEEKTTDYEACFSVKNMAGPVERYKSIEYTAYTIDGKQIKGTTSGFLARVMQHEIDHLDGKLFIDLVPKGKLLTLDEYRKMRAEAMQVSARAETN